MAYGMITELEAMNMILSIAGDAPVTSVTSTYEQAVIARRILGEISRELQSNGLWFNETLELEIQPAVDGTVNLPSTTINAEAVGDGGDLIQRGLRFFNKAENTYIINDSVIANVIEHIEWDYTPQTFRQLAIALSKSRYNTEFFGSNDVERIAQQDIQKFQIELQRADLKNRDVNMLDNVRSANIAFSNRR